MAPARRLVYSVLTLLVFLGGLELLGRLLPANDNRTGFAAHAERGWTLPISASFEFFGVPARTNRLGLRSPEPQADPALRVVVLGDSTAFGHGVRDGETFSAQLAQRTGADVQNAGVPGYTCLQSADRYDDIAAALLPDILVVYTLHNDVRKLAAGDEVWVNRSATWGIFRLLTTGQRWLKLRQEESRVSLAQYRRCLSGLAARQQQRGGQTLLISPFDRRHLDARAAERVMHGKGHQRPYRETLAALTEPPGVSLLDLTDTAWAGELSADVLMLDLVHPAAAGHQRIAAQIQQALAAAGVQWPQEGGRLDADGG